MSSNLSSAMHILDPGLEAHPTIRAEFDKLFSKVADEALIIARARRLLEVLVVDHYIVTYSITPPYKKKLKPLFELIEGMDLDRRLSKVQVSLCHEIRAVGNKAVHYNPDEGMAKFPSFSRDQVRRVLLNCAEVFEGFHRSDCSSVFASSLSPPFDTMYTLFTQDVVPVLADARIEPFGVAETLDLLFRSVVSGMDPQWLGVLERFGENHALPARLPGGEEEALRQLRNLGMIQHDGEWLFSPNRSTSVQPTPRGHFLLGLRRGTLEPGQAVSLASEVVHDIAKVNENARMRGALLSVHRSSSVDGLDKGMVRQLRNKNLVGHKSYFLDSSEEVFLTPLGYYVAGKLIPDARPTPP